MSIVFKGRVFSVDVQTVRLPNGRTHTIETVRHPPSVVLVPMTDADHLILVQQFRHSVGRMLWEVPAGSVDGNESPEAAAARECEEEVRLVPERIERLAALFPAPGFCDEQLVFFRVSNLRTPSADSPHGPDEDEDIRTEVFTVSEAKAMVVRGDILDLKTAYALTLI